VSANGVTCERRRRDIGLGPAFTAVLALVLFGLALAAADHPAAAAGRSPPLRPPVVYSERSGLRLGTQALTGRVTLVASRPGLRWRIIGVTAWAHAAGRTLVASWNTTRLDDGQYWLELDDRGHLSTVGLFVRNHTSLSLAVSPLANASAGLDIRSTDARAVAAIFRKRSYRPGDTAVIDLWGRYPVLRIDILHVGPESRVTVGNETMEGVPVGTPVRVTGAPRHVRLHVGEWRSGLYAARLTSGTRVGFAPFIVRPRRLGEHDVAVVEPTNTWEAYNYRDANGDGVPDTWYGDPSRRTVDESRPFLSRGVPPHFRSYDLGFLHWLARSGRQVDVLAQEDIEHVSGDRLARLYRLIVFPGHHEYVTEGEYDAVQRFRDLGGNLAFLSANNFFYRVDRHGDTITRIGRWRDLGRPEAALIGVEYFAWNQGLFRSRPYTVVGAVRAPWLFVGTGLRNGDSFGHFGIEVDGRTAASPARTELLARMPDAFGTGLPAEMTYYETRAGAHVFAAGGFTLGGLQSRRPQVARFLDDLWGKLAPEEGSGVRGLAAVGAAGDRHGEDGVVYRYYVGAGYRFQPLQSFAELNALVSKRATGRVRRLGSALVARGVRRSGGVYWEYDFAYGGSPAPWRSGFVQAVAAQALARTGVLLSDDSFAIAGDEAFRAFRTLVMPLGGGLWVQEYGFSSAAILNAQLQTLLSLRSYADVTGSRSAQQVVARLHRASKTLLPRFTIGCWSRYALGGAAASVHYHEYHLQLLKALAALYPTEPIWQATYIKWSGCLG